MLKKVTIVYCENADKKAIEKAKTDGHLIRCLSKFDNQNEPFNVEKVIITGKDIRGVKQYYEAKKIKVELSKGSKSEKVEVPKPGPAAPQSSDQVETVTPEDYEKAELLKEAKALGLNVPANAKPETIVKRIQKALDEKEKAAAKESAE